MKVFIDNVIADGEVKGKLYLESDSMQFIIKEYTGNVSTDKKTGKETELYITHGYFATVAQALKHLVKMNVMASTAATIGELLEDIARIETYIQSKIAV